MLDKYYDYVEQAKKDGGQIIKRYANGIDYIFVKEKDGWYSIFDVTGGIYTPKIQAKDIKHAESYIAMIEPLPFSVEVL